MGSLLLYLSVPDFLLDARFAGGSDTVRITGVLRSHASRIPPNLANCTELVAALLTAAVADRQVGEAGEKSWTPPRKSCKYCE